MGEDPSGFDVPDYYRILGVRSDADDEEIRRAYRARARVCHPDRGGSHEQMVLLGEAFEVFLDRDRRRIYDAFRAGHTTAVEVWPGVRQHASAVAAQYPRDVESLEAWLVRESRQIQSHPTGRALAGGVALAVVGGVCGLVAGWILGSTLFTSVIVGVMAGGVIGAIAGVQTSVQDSRRVKGS